MPARKKRPTNKKSETKTNLKPKLPVLAKIIAALMLILALQVLILIFASLFLFFFSSYEKPELAKFWLNVSFQLAISIIIILVAIYLFKRKKIARVLAIIILFSVSVLNLVAEISVFEFPSSLFPLFIWSLYLLSAFYLLLSRNVKRAFG